MSENINFDELDKDVDDKIKLNLKQEKPTKKITDGWTKGPFIIGGIIAAIMILVVVVVMAWPV